MKLTLGLTKLLLAVLVSPLLLGCTLIMSGCRGEESATAAAREQQITFATPEEAGKALKDAAQSGDQDTLSRILGKDCLASLNSGDLVEDRDALLSFAAKYDRMNRWVSMSDGSMALYVGADNYQFPVPLAQTSSLQWRFDSEAGEDEVVARQIGENELQAIDVALAIANDNNASAKEAERLFSGYSFRSFNPNSGDIEDSSPAGKSKSNLVIASPVQYANSGIMTFLIDNNGKIYEKDLGPKSREVARAIVVFEPGDGWNSQLNYISPAPAHGE